MEILLEIVAWLLEGVGELALEILAELLGDALEGRWQSRKHPPAGARAQSGRRPRRGAPPPWQLRRLLLYVLLGAATGALSLTIWPRHFITDPHSQWVHLFAMPVFAALVLGLLGALRARRAGHPQGWIHLGSFANGYGCALATAWVRFQWGI